MGRIQDFLVGGGCAPGRWFDLSVMGDAGDDPEQVLGAWRAGHVDRGDLYRAVREVMWRGVKRGLARVLHQPADDQDVHDVVFKAFCELEKQNPQEIRLLLGFAGNLAYRRGMDRAAQIVRERVGQRGLVEDLGLLHR